MVSWLCGTPEQTCLGNAANQTHNLNCRVALHLVLSFVSVSGGVLNRNTTCSHSGHRLAQERDVSRACFKMIAARSRYVNAAELPNAAAIVACRHRRQ